MAAPAKPVAPATAKPAAQAAKASVTATAAPPAPAPHPIATATSPAPVKPASTPTVPVASVTQAKLTVTPVAAHLPPPPLPAPVIKPCARPFANPDLRFTDAAGFDGALAAKLRSGRPVVVDLARPYPLTGEPPAELKPWLGEVAASGGKTSLDRYCEGARGFGSFFASLFARDPRRIYRPARGYDAILHADALDQVVTQIEFRRRSRL